MKQQSQSIDTAFAVAVVLPPEPASRLGGMTGRCWIYVSASMCQSIKTFGRRLAEATHGWERIPNLLSLFLSWLKMHNIMISG